MSKKYNEGMRVMHRHFGKGADTLVASIKKISPEFSKVNVEFPFGELYNRNELDDKTRELCALAALTVQGHSLPQLKFHTTAALRTGATKKEILEVVTQMIAYCGFPAATNALKTVQEAFDEVDKTSS